MSNVLGDHGFSDAVWPSENGISDFAEEVEGHEVFDGGAVALGGPVPVEITQRFEASDVSVPETAFQASAGTLLLLPLDQVLDPCGLIDIRPVGEETMKIEGLGPVAQAVLVERSV
jgi:hypothetical protein